MKYCKICGKKIYGRNVTCGSSDCLKKARQIAQKIGRDNCNKKHITKEKLYELYVVQNKSRKEVAEIINFSEANVKKILKTYNIYKGIGNRDIHTKKTKELKYGNANYNNIKKTQETNIKKIGYKTNLVIGSSIKSVSKNEIKWLDDMGVPNDKNHRQVMIENYKVDGYKDGVVYEFLGDFWHGNPTKYNTTDINPRLKVTYGELYIKTMKRFEDLKKKGYIVKYIWESDYKKNPLN
jgi:hypothetical protein